MENVIEILNSRESSVVLTHDDADPGSWVVRRWKKILWFRKRISSDWFTNKEQAMAFANEMKRMSEERDNIHLIERKH